jgi:hypothetical protein
MRTNLPRVLLLLLFLGALGGGWQNGGETAASQNPNAGGTNQVVVK